MVTPLAKCERACLNCASSMDMTADLTTVAAGRALAPLAGRRPSTGLLTFPPLQRIEPRRSPMHRIRIALAAAVLGLLTLSAHAAVDSPVRRAFNVGAGGTLYLDTDVGNVHVVPGAGGVVVSIKRHARSQKELDRVHLTMEQQGNDVHVRNEVEQMSRWFSWGNDLDMTFDVSVPARYNVELKT